MKKNVLLVTMSVLLAAALLAGCGTKEPDYAGPMTENILSGIEQKDYTMFSRDFDDAMKAALPEDAFNSLVDLLSSKIGSYQSKSFGDATETTQSGVDMTVVIYKAKYTNETEDVLVTVTFSGKESSKKVSGLLFNSPKLRQQ